MDGQWKDIWTADSSGKDTTTAMQRQKAFLLNLGEDVNNSSGSHGVR